MATCHSCGAELPKENVHRSSLCPQCGKGVRVCLNCKFYSPGSHWDCRETISELVREKDLANFCDFFSLNIKTDDGQNDKDEGEDPRAAFNSLFND